MSSLDELNLFLKSHSDLEILELLVPDMNGIIRGKRLDVSEAKTLFSKGINFPAATHLLDSSGDVIDGKLIPLLNRVFASETSKRFPRMMPFMSGTKSSRISRSEWDFRKRFNSSRLDIL
jgi:glutamine synthetase